MSAIKGICKILIANRGEISMRIIATCRLLNISSVVIYAENDKLLPFVREADESVSLGDGDLASTYLNQNKIIKIAKSLGVDAIHPGYGFLSEKADFCSKVLDSGIVFIGPSAEVIKLMGDKIASKIKIREFGIPLIPGCETEDQSEERLMKEAREIGFPLLIKASAGGGGKGMRLVESPTEFLSVLKMAQSEAQRSFSDSRVFLEKALLNPRHIEVQVLSDKHNNHLHLFERECSIQRRHQKVLEETPSPIKDRDLIESLCQSAVKICEKLNYTGAGTIEFLVDGDKYYFLEMNTRLQVEHAITEMVTQVDLVEQQIRVAAGEKLEFQQSDLKQVGSSIEARIYAEDPDHEFLPTGGEVKFLGRSSLPGVRFDVGIEEGNYITSDYDPMCAKLIVYGSNREKATQKLAQALYQVKVLGFKTNQEFLIKVLNEKAFISGNVSTKFIENMNMRKDKNIEKSSEYEIARGIAAYLFSKNNGMKDKSISEVGEHKAIWDEISNFRNIL